MALSRVIDPPGLGRRQGAQRAVRGTIREKRYNLPDPGVHHTFTLHTYVLPRIWFYFKDTLKAQKSYYGGL